MAEIKINREQHSFSLDYSQTAEGLLMGQLTKKAPGYHTKTPNKPRGRYAKRMGFYALNRRKALGRSVLQEMRLATRSGKPLALPLLHPLLQDEWCTSVTVPMSGTV